MRILPDASRGDDAGLAPRAMKPDRPATLLLSLGIGLSQKSLPAFGFDVLDQGDSGSYRSKAMKSHET